MPADHELHDSRMPAAVYGRLYGLSKHAQPLNRDVRRRVREVFTGRYSGRRAGRATQARRLSPRLRPMGNGEFVVVGNWSSRARVDKHCGHASPRFLFRAMRKQSAVP